MSDASIPVPELAIGSVVAGKYELIRVIGQGGMGAVYEGRNCDNNKHVAIKLLVSPELIRSEELVRRFYREARASAAIESEHVVQVYDSGTDPGTGYPYMVMELLRGEDLDHVVARLGPLDPMIVAKIILQASIGLAKAHDIGIIHRDIKPANLFVSSGDTGTLKVKLLDFGIAKIKMENFSQTAGLALTRTGSMLGTPLYMSPEQAKGASKVDQRSDVWSLGVVMYYLLSGQLPYESADSLGELLVSIITGDIPLVQDRAPWVPPAIAEITHLAMSRDLSKRFQNAGGVRDALMQVVPDGPYIPIDALKPVAAPIRSSAAPKLVLTDEGVLRATRSRGGMAVTADDRTRATRGSSKRPMLYGSIAAAVALVGVVGGYAALRRPPPSYPTVAASDRVVAPTPSSQPIAPASVSFGLAVAPEGVEAFVDDEPTTVREGKVALSGIPGLSKQVRLKMREDESITTVAITQTGLVPDRVELAVKLSAIKSSKTSKATGAKSADTSGGKAPGANNTQKPPGTGLSTNTDEFR